jgi:hypothetical protein
MRGQFATLRMETLRASRSAVTDDVEEDPVEKLDDGDLDTGTNDSTPEPSPLSFFNGKPHAEGLKAYNEYLASKR